MPALLGSIRERPVEERGRIASRARTRQRTVWLVMATAMVFVAASPRGFAMFVAPAEEKGPSQAIPGVNDHGTVAGEHVPGDERLEDFKLRMQLYEVSPPPVEEQKVNSSKFERLSGGREGLKPVTIPSCSIEKVRAARQPPRDDHDFGQELFTIGSWAFVLACLGAAALGLIRIRKLTASG